MSEEVNKILEKGMKQAEKYKKENDKKEEPKEKGFFKKWKEGILTLSIEKQLKSKLIGLVGGIFGLTLALISLIYRRTWGFGIFVFFIIWIQIITFISTNQQYIQTKEMMKELEPKEEDIESPKLDKEIGNIK